jgi:pimeloyl-ACP methyl ester carboxylesterase
MLTTNLAEIAPTIKVPTLVIGAACDSIISIDQARALFATIPDARYVELESGHAVVIERPAEVLSHIDTFLKDPTRYPSGSMIVSAGP